MINKIKTPLYFLLFSPLIFFSSGCIGKSRQTPQEKKSIENSLSVPDSFGVGFEFGGSLPSDTLLSYKDILDLNLKILYHEGLLTEINPKTLKVNIREGFYDYTKKYNPKADSSYIEKRWNSMESYVDTLLSYYFPEINK